jgi:sugar transferase (PEP-CTERM/EpsH1 system associated)
MGDILFLAHRVPWPPVRGDKIRAFHILKHLSATNRVHVVAFADAASDLDRDSGLTLGEARVVWRGKSQAVAGLQALASGKPVSLTAFDHAAVRQTVADMLARHPIETIYVFSSQMAQYVPADAQAQLVMDFVDMDSAKFETYGATTRGFTGWMMRREARLLAAFEQAVAARADASLLVSEAEAALFRERTGAQRVHAVGNGIDTVAFAPDAAFERLNFPKLPIVFTGQMDYRPNIEGVAWFVDAILPQIRAKHPDVEFAIVGRNPTDGVRALSGQPGVTVTGEVPDVRPWLAAAAVVVAPLKLARGVQNKVLEAMAMARPVVASSGAATGIDHGGTVEVGDSAEAIAVAVAGLLADPARAAATGAAARRRVVDHYSWDAQLAMLDHLVGLAARDEQPSRARAVA